jgi:hypothetical protein
METNAEGKKTKIPLLGKEKDVYGKEKNTLRNKKCIY